MPIIPQQETIVQYTTNSAQPDYTFAFYAPLQTDIQVYYQASNAVPNPDADILVLGADYTVDFNDDPISGGTITLLFTPVTGDILTINRQVLASLTTTFSDARTITGDNLDAAFDRLLLLCQQNQNYNLYRNLSYIVNTYLPPAQAIPFTQLPILDSQEIWIGTGTTISAVVLEENPDVSVLRSQLAVQAQGADGARLIGYYDELNNVPNTLAAFLNNLQSYILSVVASSPITPGFVTGDLKPSFSPTPLDSGWIIWVDGTIGSAASAATVLNSATAQALYVLLWTYYSDTNCPVTPSRGLTALADFNANKPLALPLTNGRTLVNNAGTYDPLTQNIAFGEDSVVLTINQLAAHNHAITIANGTNVVNASGTGRLIGVTSGGGTLVNITGTSSNTGSDQAHENRQKSTAVYMNIRL